MCYSDSMKGIIAGTGVDKIEEIKRNSHVIETKYGDVEYFVYDSIVIIPRHCSNHSLPPLKIHYLANIEAFSLLGVDEVVGIYCVVSITGTVKMGGY